MSNIKFYRVGGCVRDKLLGLNLYDIDYCVEAESYNIMIEMKRLYTLIEIC
jgi:tRNA nucleotidyltransferase/poly(A) polymerase